MANAPKKVVFIHGVSGPDLDKFNFLKRSIEKKLNVEVELFKWQSTWPYTINKNLRLQPIRKMFARIFTDIEYALLHSFEMVETLPKADVYIGHSAGSIIAISQPEKPAIIFGSPIMLIETLNLRNQENKVQKIKSLLDTSRKILNIVCKEDIIAYPIESDNIENWTYSLAGLDLANVFFAHTSYFMNKKVSKKIVEALISFGIEKRIT